jgi:hypothetical protein
MVWLAVVVLVGCASAPVEFDPTETPFEGEWKGFDSKNGNIFTYIFTGNRWEYTVKNINTNKNDRYSTGLFNYNVNKVLVSSEHGEWTKGKIQFSNDNGKSNQNYELKGPNRLILSKNGSFTKQPYGDLVISYVTKEKLFSDIISNKEELNRIQGAWKHFNGLGTYTFSGDQFTLNVPGNSPITGTIKIKDNILYLVVSDKKFGIFFIYFLPDNKIFLIDCWDYNNLWWGLFNKR